MKKVKIKIKKEAYSIRTLREWAMLIADTLMVCVCYMGSVILGQAYIIGTEIIVNAFKALPVAAVLFVICLWAFRVNKVVWRYARGKDYLRIVGATLVATVLLAILDQAFLHWLSGKMPIVEDLGQLGENLKAYPVYFNIFFSTTGVIIVSRLIYEMVYARLRDRALPRQKKRTMIIGAGYTASAILEELSRGSSIYNPVCLVDDDPDKLGRIIGDVEVVGTTKEIPRLVRKYDVSTIIFAIPSIDPQTRQSILSLCMQTGCQLKVLPYMSEMISNVDLVGQARDINIGDLLGREQISFNDKGVKGYIQDKVCLITGGGGSIGSELVRQIAKYDPRRIIVLDVYENCAYEIQQEMKRNYGDKVDLDVEIASVTDEGKMRDLFEEYHPQIVFHAAAHKHVPLMETNPEEAVKNNVFGTLNVVKLSYEFKVAKFIMISTDKAVNPTNVMGATKRCCEEIIETMHQLYGNSVTEFAAVRFGNVLGSNGSVIPLFKEQIKKGGPVTVTHPEIIRYFMTIPEAVSLVLQAGAYAHGGEIFVLDMGEPVKIVTLAENMIKMMGYTPYEDIQIKFTGLRPGEKLYEELLMKEEGLRKTDNNKIFIGRQVRIDTDRFIAELEKMRGICASNDKKAVVEQLKVLVPTFHHDTVYFEQMMKRDAQYQKEYAEKVRAEEAKAGKEADAGKPTPTQESGANPEPVKEAVPEKIEPERSAEDGKEKKPKEKAEKPKSGGKKTSAKRK